MAIFWNTYVISKYVFIFWKKDSSYWSAQLVEPKRVVIPWEKYFLSVDEVDQQISLF